MTQPGVATNHQAPWGANDRIASSCVSDEPVGRIAGNRVELVERRFGEPVEARHSRVRSLKSPYRTWKLTSCVPENSCSARAPSRAALLGSHPDLLVDEVLDLRAGLLLRRRGAEPSDGEEPTCKSKTSSTSRSGEPLNSASRRCARRQEFSGAQNITFQVQYGDLTNELALASLDRFAKAALDKLHTIPSDPPDWLVADVLEATDR